MKLIDADAFALQILDEIEEVGISNFEHKTTRVVDLIGVYQELQKFPAFTCNSADAKGFCPVCGKPLNENVNTDTNNPIQFINNLAQAIEGSTNVK